MAQGGGASSSDILTTYSIQRTYILTLVFRSAKPIFTCNHRIDIPTIEPLVTSADGSELTRNADGSGRTITVVPCIEIAGKFLSEFDLTFETNEGVTVLPAKIPSRENLYKHVRYVLVLPRGATGVKSCKVTLKGTDEEIQHNFTFGIMPPPYNYDNALFGAFTTTVADIMSSLSKLTDLNLTTRTPIFVSLELPKGDGEKTININNDVLFYETVFSYPLSPESTIHKPKITLHGGGRDQVYTLSLNRATNNVSIDLFTGMITVYDGVTGEIIQQFKIALPNNGFETLSFENFDDIDDNVLRVTPKGARVI